MAPRQHPKYCEPERPDYSCRLPARVTPPQSKGDRIFTKVCTIVSHPEPPPPTPCQIQRHAQKLKDGVKFCPKAPPPTPPPPPPHCMGVCIERIKNPMKRVCININKNSFYNACGHYRAKMAAMWFATVVGNRKRFC